MSDYSQTFTVRRLWLILAASMLLMFGTLLYFGGEIYHLAPPIPERVLTESGDTLFTRTDIERGQNVWQSIGGMQQGSIWGHGSYLAPDWSADWLHREATDLKERRNADVQVEMRRNTYDSERGTITVSAERAQAIRTVGDHYRDMFEGRSEAGLKLREQYAFPVHTRLSDGDAAALNAFFFWTSWAATTNRPGDTITYTSNWPHEPLVGNVPTAPVFLWTFISILVLLAGIGAIVWYYARMFDVWRRDLEPETGLAKVDFMESATITPSMRATAKLFWVVAALFLVQMLLGVVTAHYAVEGQGLYGLPMSDDLPYVITRTWHTQLAVLWIATAWLATGLYVAPLLSGHEPKLQRFGVNFLFVSLLVIVVGAFAGQWLAVNGRIHDLVRNFWFGHQGYEYV
ncbi:MAG: cbb3-type cytochrome c oxidase subunit I, partial [Steroidobacteraceae bacterium]